MKLLMLTSLTISSSLVYSHHPIMIMILIIAQTLTTCLMIWLLMPTAWFSFILFLIFIGGLMVLFIYITSLAANETFNLSASLTTSQVISLVSLTLAACMTSTFFNHPHFHATPLNKQISLIFSGSLSFNTMLIMSYLLVTLVVVVKISTKINGPIRNMLTQA